MDPRGSRRGGRNDPRTGGIAFQGLRARDERLAACFAHEAESGLNLRAHAAGGKLLENRIVPPGLEFRERAGLVRPEARVDGLYLGEDDKAFRTKAGGEEGRSMVLVDDGVHAVVTSVS